MKLEVGKRYTDRSGRVYGPLVRTDLGRGDSQDFPFSDGQNRTWEEGGSYYYGMMSEKDLIAEAHDGGFINMTGGTGNSFQVGDTVSWLGLTGTVTAIVEDDQYPVNVSGKDAEGRLFSAQFTQEGTYLVGQALSLVLVERAKPKATNKLKVGDKVSVNSLRVQWEVEHMEEVHSIGGDSKTFQDKDLRRVATWFAASQGRTLVGEVVGFGSKDEDNERLCVKVSAKNAFGGILEFMSEDDVIKLEEER